jgi:hypothetical protein
MLIRRSARRRGNSLENGRFVRSLGTSLSIDPVADDAAHHLDKSASVLYADHMGSRNQDDAELRDRLLALDVDCRLLFLWLNLWGDDEWDLDSVASYARFAYWQGYADSLTEARRGSLYRDHGYPVPKRQTARKQP